MLVDFSLGGAGGVRLKRMSSKRVIIRFFSMLLHEGKVFIHLFILFIFIFGCVGSLLLRAGFL